MAYIGQSIKNGTFSVLDTSGNTYNSSNTTFSLGTQVGAAAQLLVSKNGVIQKPGTDFTLATGGTQITFTTAPASGDNIFIVEISGAVGGTITPVDGSVTADKLNTAILTGQTDIGGAIADADLFLLDDGAGGTLRKTAASRLKTYVGGDNTPAFFAYNVATQAVANATNTQLNFGTELYDTDSAFTSNTFTVPSGEGGKYFIGGGFRIDGGADAKYAQLNVYVNDSIVFNFTNRMVGDETHSFNGSITYTLSASDTVKLYTKQNSGSSQDYTSESGEKRQFFTMFKIAGA